MLKRALSLLILVLVIFAGTRAMVRALPGDPVETLIAETGTSIPPQALRAELGLDRPFFPALLADLKDAVRGEWGSSIISRAPVAPILRARLLKTLELTCVSLAFGLALSLAIGLIAAGGRVSFGAMGHGMDQFCSIYGGVMAALPTPWTGPLLLVLFAVWIPLFPVGGSVILPALTLALSFAGLWSRLIRERVREVLRLGASQGARARGASEWRVLLKYGLAPAMGSLVAYLGTQFGSLMAGAFLTEVIFDWKGMGALLVDAVLQRDYPVVESATFVAASFSLCGTLLGDWLQSRLDPRLSKEGADS